VHTVLKRLRMPYNCDVLPVSEAASVRMQTQCILEHLNKLLELDG
jgi:hypothetical protein